jgi:raffinose synthase
VLRALALPDGTTLGATGSARLCADCLFRDVSHDGVTALKLAAPNGDEAAVLGLYNVQGGHWRRDERRFAFGENATLACSYKPRDASVAFDAFDAGARWAAYEFRSNSVRVLGADDSVKLTLEPAGFRVVALRRLRAWKGVAYAPLGLLDMLNGGGAVLACDEGADGARVKARGPGRFGVYAERAPETVTVDGARVEAAFADGLVTLDLAAAGEREVVLSWE